MKIIFNGKNWLILKSVIGYVGISYGIILLSFLLINYTPSFLWLGIINLIFGIILLSTNYYIINKNEKRNKNKS
jgi:hypothetical protein